MWQYLNIHRNSDYLPVFFCRLVDNAVSSFAYHIAFVELVVDCQGGRQLLLTEQARYHDHFHLMRCPKGHSCSSDLQFGKADLQLESDGPTKRVRTDLSTARMHIILQAAGSECVSRAPNPRRCV